MYCMLKVRIHTFFFNTYKFWSKEVKNFFLKLETKKGKTVKKLKSKIFLHKIGCEPPCVVRDRESTENPRITRGESGFILGFLSLSLSLTTQGVGLREYFVYKYFPFSFFTFIPFFTFCFLFSLLSSKLLCITNICKSLLMSLLQKILVIDLLIY